MYSHCEVVDEALPARGSLQEVVDLALHGERHLGLVPDAVLVLQDLVHLVNDRFELHPRRARPLCPVPRGCVIPLAWGAGQMVVVCGWFLIEPRGSGGAVV